MLCFAFQHNDKQMPYELPVSCNESDSSSSLWRDEMSRAWWGSVACAFCFVWLIGLCESLPKMMCGRSPVHAMKAIRVHPHDEMRCPVLDEVSCMCIFVLRRDCSLEWSYLKLSINACQIFFPMAGGMQFATYLYNNKALFVANWWEEVIVQSNYFRDSQVSQSWTTWVTSIKEC